MTITLQELCQDFHYTSSLRNFFYLTSPDTLIVQIISPIAVLCSIFNIVFFSKVSKARQPPYDIILLVSIFSILTIIAYIATVIYNAIHPPGDNESVPSDFEDFCLGVGSLKVFSEVGIITYNCVFSFYYVFKIKNPLKSWMKQNKEMHVLCIVLTSLITGLVFLLNEVGISLFGICGVKISKETFFIQLCLCILYFLTLVISSAIFLKYLKKISKYDHRTKKFFKYYSIYTLFMSFIYIFQSIILSVLIGDCYFGVSPTAHSILVNIINALILSIPIINSIIIFFHPQIKKGALGSIFERKKNKDTNDRRTFYDDLLTSSRGSVQIQLTQISNQEQTSYISSLKERNRISLLVTLLGSITLQQLELNYAQMKQRQQSYELLPWKISDRYELDIKEQISEEYENIFVKNIPVVLIRFISYSPSLFQNLVKLDGIQNIHESLNPHRNIQKIKANVQADGGSSGQFFYFSQDNRFILKTITKKELAVLLDRLDDYHTHFVENRNSLIVKIYGVFTTLNTETGEAIHFMMMGNLLQIINRKYVSRLYDMKGSSHHREVFKKDEIKDESSSIYSKKTMKDLDFERLQKKIWIHEKQSERIKEVLKKDSFFFFTKGLIDYSLIVIKVDFQTYMSEKGKISEKIKKNEELFMNERTMVKSNKEPGIIYVFGIIDYLETWNVKKKGEKWYKSLWTKSEGISSQNPQYYYERFCENLVDKIFP